MYYHFTHCKKLIPTILINKASNECPLIHNHPKCFIPFKLYFFSIILTTAGHKCTYERDLAIIHCMGLYYIRTEVPL